MGRSALNPQARRGKRSQGRYGASMGRSRQRSQAIPKRVGKPRAIQPTRYVALAVWQPRAAEESGMKQHLRLGSDPP